MPARPIQRLAHLVVLSWGWRRAAIAFAAGAISVLAMAPFDAWPVLWLTFPILVWLVDGAAAGKLGGIFSAAIAGWWFGFGYFVAGLYWIGYAFLVDAQTFGWLLPFAVSGLPAYLALYTALALALARLLWTRGPMRLIALAVAITVAEWLRGHLLSGFPWNTFGYALTDALPLAQGAALIGIWGLTFLAALVFPAGALLADDAVDTPRPWRPILIGVVTLAALAGYGAVRLWLSPTEFVDGVRLRIMQPNLPQDQKFNYSAKQRVMSHYVALSQRAGETGGNGLRDVTHLIWPESAFPFLLTREPDAMAQIANLLPPNAVLITGAVRAADIPGRPNSREAYNSIYVIDHTASILSVYDKVHLVPFGEYLPFQTLLERLGISQLTKLPGGFLAGDRARVMPIPRAPAAMPFICYEIIFPGTATPRDQRPGWLINLTNDGWFGISTGPYQHLQQARVRAIEQGLPLVRAANTGVSAVIDAMGRTVKSLPLGVEGILDSALPRENPPTLYVLTGDGIVTGLICIGIALIVRRRVRRT